MEAYKQEFIEFMVANFRPLKKPKNIEFSKGYGLGSK